MLSSGFVNINVPGLVSRGIVSVVVCLLYPSNSTLLGGLLCTIKLAITLYRLLAVGRECLLLNDELFFKQWVVDGLIVGCNCRVSFF